MAKKKNFSIADAISAVQAEVGMPLDYDCGFLPLRCFSSNLLLGGQGLRRGCVVEIFGPEGCGKSTLAYEALGIAAAEGDIVILVDQEKAGTSARLAKFGLFEGENMVVIRGRYIEEMYDKVMKAINMLRKLKPDARIVIMLDSLGIMNAQALFEMKELGGDKNEKVAANAKAWAIVFRSWFGQTINHDTNITVLAINHVTSVIQTGWAAPGSPTETTPGGRTPKYVSWTRLEVKPGKQIKNGTQVIGRQIWLKTIKCRDAPPFQRIPLAVYFGNPAKSADDPTDFVGSLDWESCYLHLQQVGAIRSNKYTRLYDWNGEDTGKELDVSSQAAFVQQYNDEATRQLIYATMMKWHYALQSWNPALLSDLEMPSDAS